MTDTRIPTDYEYPKIFEGLAQAAGEMKAIPKDQRNQQQNFDYRSIESIVGHAKPLLRDAGLAIIPTGFDLIQTEQVQSSGGARGWRTIVRGRWLITHNDGSTVEAAMLGEAVDYGDKSASKAVQMAYKYLLTQLLGIGSEDPDGYSPQMVAEEPTQIRPADWLAARVQMFKEWNDDRRKEQYTAAMEALEIERFKTQEHAEQVFEWMSDAYYTEFPSDDTAPF